MKEPLVGAELKRERRAAGLTQAELGEKIGVTGSAVGQWEQNRTKPSWRQAQELARILRPDESAAVSPFQSQLDALGDEVARLREQVAELTESAAIVAERVEERLAAVERKVQRRSAQ